MDIGCSHFTICSGCMKTKHVDELASFKEASLFFAKYGIVKLPFHTGNPCHWRIRAKLAVRGSYQKPQIGLFKAGTHQVEDIPFCKIHHPAINRAVEAVKQWMMKHAIMPYDDVTGKGLLRYVQMSVERSTGLIQLALVVNATSQDFDAAFPPYALDSLWNDFPLWHSIWLNFNTRRDNVILSDVWQLRFGEKFLWETIREQSISFLPGSFIQANLEMFERLLVRLEQFIWPDVKLIEFYAGVGAIGISLAKHCKAVDCIEIVPMGKECFEESLKKMPSLISQKLSYTCADVKTQMHLLKQSADVILVDPPRKGLEAKFLKAICEDAVASRLVYVSCGWESFKRDCEVLTSHGWKLTHAEAFLFFPGSEHIETLAIFDTETQNQP